MKMKRLSAVALTAVAGLLSTGCATIVKGSSQNISVSSNVSGADVLLDGEKVGVTPFFGSVPKNKGALTVQKPGFAPQTLALAKSLEPIFWGNIITGGTLGSTTDFSTGAAYEYAPAAYQVDLRPDGATQSASFERQAAARKFAMLHLDQISSDLAQGGGEHLAALLRIVNGEGAAHAGAADVREALRASGGDPVRFGQGVVSLI